MRPSNRTRRRLRRRHALQNFQQRIAMPSLPIKRPAKLVGNMSVLPTYADLSLSDLLRRNTAIPALILPRRDDRISIQQQTSPRIDRQTTRPRALPSSRSSSRQSPEHQTAYPASASQSSRPSARGSASKLPSHPPSQQRPHQLPRPLDRRVRTFHRLDRHASRFRDHHRLPNVVLRQLPRHRASILDVLALLLARRALASARPLSPAAVPAAPSSSPA